MRLLVLIIILILGGCVSAERAQQLEYQRDYAVGEYYKLADECVMLYEVTEECIEQLQECKQREF